VGELKPITVLLREKALASRAICQEIMEKEISAGISPWD
jgi:hypothetical protein